MSRKFPWLTALLPAFALVTFAAFFAGEARHFRRTVLELAGDELAARVALAAENLRVPLATGDFKSIRAFGDGSAADGERLTIFGAGGGVLFDTLDRRADGSRFLYVETAAGDWTVRLGVPLDRVLRPCRSANVGFLLAALSGGAAVLIAFFAFYRQREKLRRERAKMAELARLEQERRAFVADFSHELKTPLTGILGAADMLEDGNPLVGLIKKEARRLNALAQQILDLSRLERAEPVLEKAETELADLVRETVDAQRPAAERGGVELTVSVPDKPCVCRCDGRLVSQALANLVANAVRHAHADRVTVALAEAADGIRLSVEDRGVGIPPEHREAIFERFHRVDASRTAETGGAGLGLSIVRRIARLHGGDVGYEPVEPHGSRFVLSFPSA